MKSLIAATLISVCLVQPGIAQIWPGGSDAQPKNVTISVQLSSPAPAVSSSEDMTKAMSATTQAIYNIINHECEVLTATLAGSCRLVRLNTGSNFNDVNVPGFGVRPGPGVSANATATFEIKPTAQPTPSGAAPPTGLTPPPK